MPLLFFDVDDEEEQNTCGKCDEPIVHGDGFCCKSCGEWFHLYCISETEGFCYYCCEEAKDRDYGN